MKKLISFLVLALCFANIAKAQPSPKILISYDENGNRILRYYQPYRPAPPQQQTDGVVIAGDGKSKQDVIPSGLAAVPEEQLKVYPNPSNDNFNVTVSEGILNSQAELVMIDQLGREHKRVKIKSQTTTLSTKGMADGVYSIIVRYGDTKSTTKVIKVTD